MCEREDELYESREIYRHRTCTESRVESTVKKSFRKDLWNGFRHEDGERGVIGTMKKDRETRILIK